MPLFTSVTLPTVLHSIAQGISGLDINVTPSPVVNIDIIGVLCYVCDGMVYNILFRINHTDLIYVTVTNTELSVVGTMTNNANMMNQMSIPTILSSIPNTSPLKVPLKMRLIENSEIKLIQNTADRSVICIIYTNNMILLLDSDEEEEEEEVEEESEEMME